jgi:hypothetical protein
MSPAGVCAPSCDPLADNAFQGSDVGSKTGITCGSSNAVGCYGFPSDGSGAPPPTHFICALFAGGYTGLDATGNLVHRSPVPLAEQFLNSCAPGYNLSIFLDATGSAQVDCFAFCAPANSYGPLGGANVGTAASGPNGGKSADGISHQCNTTDARGAFGATATPGGTNGEHCTYTWLFELDENTGALHLSPTSDTVGICIDHTKYRYDSNGDGTITAADAFWPACPTIPLAASGSNDPLWAGHFGCVDHTHGGPDGGALGVAPSGPSHFVMERPHPIALRRSMR